MTDKFILVAGISAIILFTMSGAMFVTNAQEDIESEQELMSAWLDNETCSDKYDYLKNQGDDWSETYDLGIYRHFVLECLFK